MRRPGIGCTAGSDSVPEYAVRRQRRRIQRLLDYEQAERRSVADRLEQDAAHTLVAAVLELTALERATQDAPTGKRLAAVRGALGSLVGDLRQLVAQLHSPVLEGLGLATALEQLAESAGALELRPVAVLFDDRVGELPPEVARTIHQLAEDMLAATAGPLEIRVRRPDAGHVELVVTTGGDELGGHVVDAGRLVMARARTELRGGHLTIHAGASGDVLLRAELPAAQPASSR
jgi:signal transduction histidine kinase